MSHGPVEPSPTHERVVQYVYVHDPGERFQYPTGRARNDIGLLATRYLECALVQAASLRFNGAACELALVSNLRDRRLLGRRGMRTLDALLDLGVTMIHADYAHRPPASKEWFYASRYVLDAIVAATAQAPPGQRQWMLDSDCLWVRPEQVFAAGPRSGTVGCIVMPYNIDWDLSGGTRSMLASLMSRPLPAQEKPLWIGGELLAGTAADLLGLLAACEEIDGQIEGLGPTLGTEEQLLTLASALERVRFHDMGSVGARIPTGPRHRGWVPEDPCALGLWHLPSEKGLSFRRAAGALIRGRSRRLRRDLASPDRARRRFNVATGKWTPRRVRDDSWLLASRMRELLPASRRRGSSPAGQPLV